MAWLLAIEADQGTRGEHSRGGRIRGWPQRQEIGWFSHRVSRSGTGLWLESGTGACSSDGGFGSLSISLLVVAGVEALDLSIKFSGVLTKLVEILIQSWALIQELALK